MEHSKQPFLKRLLSVRGMGAALTAFAGLIIIYIAFGLINPTVFSGRNIVNLTRSMSKYLIIGIGQSYLLITGNIDLSIGSVVGIPYTMHFRISQSDFLPGLQLLHPGHSRVSSMLAMFILTIRTSLKEIVIRPFESIIVCFAVLNDIDMAITATVLNRKVVEHMALEFIYGVLHAVLVDNLPFIGGHCVLKVTDGFDYRSLRLEFKSVFLVSTCLHQRLPSAASLTDMELRETENRLGSSEVEVRAHDYHPILPPHSGQYL